MIADGDRVLVGVSGGKDSMSLLRLLLHRLGSSHEKYSIWAAHIVGDSRGTAIGIDSEFRRWLDHQTIPVVVTEMIVPEDEPLPMNCERCSRNRRRTLFQVADEIGCNKIALGHNMEDFANTALMNLLSSGKLATMAFRRDYFGGKFSVIRPLSYISEHDLARFAKSCAFPVMEAKCPLAATSRRKAARDIMRSISREFKWAGVNLVRAARASEGLESDLE
jgi:tRNA 2-thiocytidine biosynthesis protein TtcA